MVESGIVKKFYALADFYALGYWQYKVYIKLQNQNQEKEMLDFIADDDHAHWVSRCRGSYDLIYYLHVENPAQFAKTQNEINERFGSSIQKRDVLIAEQVIFFSKPFTDGNCEIADLLYGKVNANKLDDKNRKILSVLQSKGLAKKHEITKNTLLTQDIVSYRIMKMKESGLIHCIRADIDLEKIGFALYKVLIKLVNHSPKLFKKIEDYSRGKKHIIQYLKVIGPWDVELEYVTKEREQLENELDELREELRDSIKDYEVLETYDERKLNFFPFGK
jgi:DNA-binding Lrp family transcriptional regulator